MPLFNVTELRAGLVPGQRLLGIDPGARRIGLALSDVALLVATPYGTIPRGKLAAVAASVGALGPQFGVGGLVVGLPLSMDGSLGPTAQAVRDWTHALCAATGLPAALWDERLSSAAVNRDLIAQDFSRVRRKKLVDSMAAAWILQAALDASAVN